MNFSYRKLTKKLHKLRWLWSRSNSIQKLDSKIKWWVHHRAHFLVRAFNTFFFESTSSHGPMNIILSNLQIIITMSRLCQLVSSVQMVSSSTWKFWAKVAWQHKYLQVSEIERSNFASPSWSEECRVQQVGPVCGTKHENVFTFKRVDFGKQLGHDSGISKNYIQDIAI